jgi:hypothetical protein
MGPDATRRNTMKKLLIPLLLATFVGAVPASAQGWRSPLTPVQSFELNKFVGTTLKGKAMQPLGIVAGVNRNTGMIGVVSRHGHVASIHNSLLFKNGARLRAPELTSGDVARASGMHRPLVRPEIIIEEIYLE